MGQRFHLSSVALQRGRGKEITHVVVAGAQNFDGHAVAPSVARPHMGVDAEIGRLMIDQLC